MHTLIHTNWVRPKGFEIRVIGDIPCKSLTKIDLKYYFSEFSKTLTDSRYCVIYVSNWVSLRQFIVSHFLLEVWESHIHVDMTMFSQ